MVAKWIQLNIQYFLIALFSTLEGIITRLSLNINKTLLSCKKILNFTQKYALIIHNPFN